MEATACHCDFDYDCVAVIHKEIIRTARKPHKCIECREQIQPGEKYHDFNQLAEGSWHNFKVCTPCERIRNNFCAPYSMLKEYLMDYLGFDYVTGEEV
jgi:hypothetical protein